jgi:ribose transport system substrate-binding protein
MKLRISQRTCWDIREEKNMKKMLVLSAIAAGSIAAAPAAFADGHLSLEGQTIGVAVVGTQHFWDREAFNGAVSMVEELGGTVVPVDGGRDNQVHADNHDILLNQGVDAVISILGDGAVEPRFEALVAAGIPVFTVDHLSPFGTNNTTSDNYYMGTTIGRYMADALGGEGRVAVFNAFEGALRICGIRAGLWRYVLQDYPGIEVIQPELAEEFANAPENARIQTLDLLSQYPEGELDAIHVGCWDQPAIGIVQALEEAGRTDVIVTALDGGPDTLEIMAEEGSPFVANVAQQPSLIGSTAAMNVARHFAGEDLLPQTFVDVVPVQGRDGAIAAYEALGYGSLE